MRKYSIITAFLYLNSIKGDFILNKAEILQYLIDKQIPFTKYEHEPIFSVEEGDKSNLPNREKVIRNLFLCDAKKKNFYLVSLFVHKNINLKELSEKIPSKRLSFAKQETMKQMLEVKPGSVTPLAILNNKDKNILMIFDSELQNQTIGMHPMENTATVFLKFEDLYNLLLPHGNEIRIIDL